MGFYSTEPKPEVLKAASEALNIFTSPYKVFEAKVAIRRQLVLKGYSTKDIDAATDYLFK